MLPIPGRSIPCTVRSALDALHVDDMIGLSTEFHPRFVRRYAAVAQAIEASISDYASDGSSRAAMSAP